MSKEKMLDARDLIRQKRYDEARMILKTVNHPKARQWLSRLSGMAPREAAASPVQGFQVTQDVVITDGVQARRPLSQHEIDLLVRMQRLSIEKKLRLAQAEIERHPACIASWRPESFITTGFGKAGYAYAVSGPLAITPEQGAARWRTIICLPGELDAAKVNLDEHCLSAANDGRISRPVSVGQKIIVGETFLRWSRQALAEGPVLKRGEMLTILTSEPHDLDGLPCVLAANCWGLLIPFPVKFIPGA